jgi:hypothetical protein
MFDHSGAEGLWVREEDERETERERQREREKMIKNS